MQNHSLKRLLLRTGRICNLVHIGKTSHGDVCKSHTHKTANSRPRKRLENIVFLDRYPRAKRRIPKQVTTTSVHGTTIRICQYG